MKWIVRSMVLFLALATGARMLQAATCSVPTTTYPNIQSAVDDATCSPVVLASGTFSEEVTITRTLTLEGTSSAATIVEGRVAVTGGTVQLNNMRIGTATPTGTTPHTSALSSSGGAQVSGVDLVVLKAEEVPLFADGFESSTTNAWSNAVP
jgi:hypothetical protein